MTNLNACSVKTLPEKVRKAGHDYSYIKSVSVWYLSAILMKHRMIEGCEAEHIIKQRNGYVMFLLVYI